MKINKKKTIMITLNGEKYFFLLFYLIYYDHYMFAFHKGMYISLYAPHHTKIILFSYVCKILSSLTHYLIM